MQLQDVCQAIVDCEHKTAPLEESGYPSIRTPNIGPGYLILEGVNRVSRATYLAWTRRLLPQPGDLIMAREAPVGNVAMIPDGLEPCLGQRTLLIRPDTKAISSRYLVFLLISPIIQSQIQGKTNGATVAHLNMSDVRKFELPILPPLAIQHRISSILSAYDDLIENHRKRIAILEEMARRLYRQWFVDFRYHGLASVPLVQSQLGRIPENWEVRKFSSLAEYRNGYAFKPGDLGTIGIPIIKIKELKAGISSDTPRNIGSTIPLKYHFDSGSVLFSWSADLEAYLWSGGPGLLNQHLFLVLPCPGIHKDWFFHALKEEMPRFRSLSLGSTMQHIKRSALDQVSTLWPGSLLANRFGELVRPLHELGINLQSQLTILRRTRDLLLPRLMSGALSVADLTAAEAAVP